MTYLGIAGGSLIVGVILGALFISLCVMAHAEKVAYSPMAPPECVCGHRPWQHTLIPYVGGFVHGGCLCHCDCSSYRPLWPETTPEA